MPHCMIWNSTMIFRDGFLKSTAALVTNNSDGITITIF